MSQTSQTAAEATKKGPLEGSSASQRPLRRRGGPRLYRDLDGTLTPDEEWAISLQWAHIKTRPAVMCGAYEAVLACRDWAAAAAAAETAGAPPAEATMLADRLVVALSLNRTRHAWVVAVSDAAPDGPVGRETAEWLIDANLTVNARLGVRIAAEAAVRALSAMDPHDALTAARTLMLSLHAATLPDPALVLRCVAGVGAFVHRRRCYLLSPHEPAAANRIAAASLVAATPYRRRRGLWNGPPAGRRGSVTTRRQRRRAATPSRSAHSVFAGPASPASNLHLRASEPLPGTLASGPSSSVSASARVW